jgi:hypothetical protein
MASPRPNLVDEKSSEKNPEMMTAKQVLETLLANPPQKVKIEADTSSYSFNIFPPLDPRFNWGNTIKFESYEAATNALARAVEASKLDLVVSPLSKPDSLFYTKKENYPKQLEEAQRLKREQEEAEAKRCKCTIL